MTTNIRNVVSVIACLVCSLSLAAGGQHLLPKPQDYRPQSGRGFSLNRSITFSLPRIEDHDPAVDDELQALIVQHGGSVGVSAGPAVSVSIVPEVDGAEFQPEAYSIVVTADSVRIRATTLKGAYWAVQTLWQLAEDNGGMIDCCQITDWPAFSLRGYTHDVGRGYLGVDVLKSHIEKLSRYKINLFHWHLTENQGWRLESKVYPQLNADSAYSRLPGKFYSIEEAMDVVRFANRHGVTVIPEIDMPGHSEAFRKAMGHSMLTPQGLEEMKQIMTEACETFRHTPWMHIGTDELRSGDLGSMDWTKFVPEMVSHIRGLGKKVVSWNPGYSYKPEEIDMIHMWSSAGRPTPGVPAIDSRYFYANHFDNYADIISLYKTTISEQTKGSHQFPGVIVSFWNDRNLPSDADVARQNNLFASMLAIGERAWLGGGDGYVTEVGTLLKNTDADFFNWENRFLFHKERYLKHEGIPYVRQSNIKWRVTEPFPNEGDLARSFPPETEGIKDSYIYGGKTYSSSPALGAGVYLRHVWGTIVPGFYADPQPNHTAYAYTNVYSPSSRTVGLMLEFQNYSRSESDIAAPTGMWDHEGSRIWINDKEIPAPEWENTHKEKSNEITLKNENMVARAPIPVTLKAGWNTVMMKMPVGAFTRNEVRLVKWMFNCVFTTPDGSKEAEGLVYSPERILDRE